jgi:hypothetical protein
VFGVSLGCVPMNDKKPPYGGGVVGASPKEEGSAQASLAGSPRASLARMPHRHAHQSDAWPVLKNMY